jgi:protein farnesyltransferase/geranylgeranyltransferase type-1 subunit alpha
VLFHHEGGISQDQNVKQVCEALYSSGNRSPFLLAFLVDMCEESVQRGDGDKAYTHAHAIEVLSHNVKDFICRVILCLSNI